MRVLVAISSGIFLMCMLSLVYKRLLFALFLALSLFTFPQNALASCTTSTVTMGDGRLMLCTTCCSSAGVCDTHCY
jgi:hypothetical protein